MKSPNIQRLTHFAFAAIASITLASCAVSPNGPVRSGGSHGTLGSPNMSDYFYHTSPGWAYVFKNVENIYNSDGSVAQTLTGSNDTVRTMGFDQIGPNGDSLFRYEITYRVSESYAGRQPFALYYIPSTHSSLTNGAFVNPGDTVVGMLAPEEEPYPISTDTILAGIGGLIRTRTNDFTNSSSYVWQTDTIWYSEHLDSAFIWEHEGGYGPIVKERCIFLKNFHTAETWNYDVINDPSPTTTCYVVDDDMSWSTLAGTWDHTAEIRLKTTDLENYDFNREYKYYACFVGPVYQYDWWYVTSDGDTFNKQDFTRSLISLTHN